MRIDIYEVDFQNYSAIQLLFSDLTRLQMFLLLCLNHSSKEKRQKIMD